MNDRIQELAKEADKLWDGASPEDSEWCVKFAKLIVKECVTVLEQHHPYTTDPEAYHYAISLIEEHFGVEE